LNLDSSRAQIVDPGHRRRSVVRAAAVGGCALFLLLGVGSSPAAGQDAVDLWGAWGEWSGKNAETFQGGYALGAGYVADVGLPFDLGLDVLFARFDADQLAQMRPQPAHPLPQALPARLDVERAERAPHRQHELFVVKRLGQIVAGIQAQGFEHEVLVAVRREHDHPDARRPPPRPGEGGREPGGDLGDVGAVAGMAVGVDR